MDEWNGRENECQWWKTSKWEGVSESECKWKKKKSKTNKKQEHQICDIMF